MIPQQPSPAPPELQREAIRALTLTEQAEYWLERFRIAARNGLIYQRCINEIALIQLDLEEEVRLRVYDAMLQTKRQAVYNHFHQLLESHLAIIAHDLAQGTWNIRSATLVVEYIQSGDYAEYLPEQERNHQERLHALFESSNLATKEREAQFVRLNQKGTLAGSGRRKRVQWDVQCGELVAVDPNELYNLKPREITWMALRDHLHVTVLIEGLAEYAGLEVGEVEAEVGALLESGHLELAYAMQEGVGIRAIAVREL